MQSMVVDADADKPLVRLYERCALECGSKANILKGVPEAAVERERCTE